MSRRGVRDRPFAAGRVRPLSGGLPVRPTKALRDHPAVREHSEVGALVDRLQSAKPKLSITNPRVTNP